MKHLFSLLFVGVLGCLPGLNSLQAQQKIGGTPGAVNASAILELQSVNRGFLLPRLSTAQRDAINLGSQSSAPRGLMIYNTDTDCVEYWNGTGWKSLCSGGTSSNAQVSSLDCANPKYAGNAPVAGSIVTGFNVGIDYSGGNGGNVGAQQVSSTGVGGLTASLSDGSIATGSGTLNFTITGTAQGPGTAVFAFTFGGQSCSFSVPVAPPAAVATLTNCGVTLTPSNTLTAGSAVPAGTTVSLSYTGGNGGGYSPINVSSAGISGLFAGAAQGTINNGNGSLVLTLTGTPAAGPAGTATFNIPFAGNTCPIQVPVAAGGGSITGFADCPGTASPASLTQGASYTTASNVTITLNYSGGNGGPYQAVSQPSSGVTGLFASLNAGNFASGAGALTFSITGTPSGTGTAQFSISLGWQTCILQIPVAAGLTPVPANVALTAGQKYFITSVTDNNYLPYTAPTGPATTTPSAPDGTTETPVFIQGTLTTAGVSIKIPYVVTSSSASLPAFSQTVNVPAGLAQDGIARDVTLSYPAQTLAPGSGSITATLAAVGGTLNAKQLDINTGIGNDNLGVLLAEFTLSTNGFGGTGKVQARDIAPIPDRNVADANHRYLYAPVMTATGRTWLNNNLGADYANLSNALFNPARQAAGSNDFHAYGSLFQWGRYSDGHELINWSSATAGASVYGLTATLSGSDNPGTSLFITATSAPNDWRSPPNDNLWQGLSGINNPCPPGFRLPTQAEWQTELTANGITSSATAFSSLLKLSAAGYRSNSNGGYYSVSNNGEYWSSTLISASAPYSGSYMLFSTSVANVSFTTVRAVGESVRCIQN